MRLLWLSLVCLLFAAASCGTGAYVGRAAAQPEPSLASPMASDPVDSRGEAKNSVGFQAGLNGAFFSDGGDGDVRARSEQLFSSRFAAVADPSQPAAGQPGAGQPGAGQPGAGQPGVGAAESPRRDRMLIYSGDLRVEVSRAEDAGEEFLAKVEAWGGYLQSQAGTALTVRVPATRFDEAFELARSAGRVLAENRRASDVTEEYVDLGIRADNARKSRARLLEILEKADKVEDILKIEAELRRLTEELERMEGRLKFLADQVAMSTLTADFRAAAQAAPPVRKRRWSRFGWVNQVGAQALMEAF